LVESGRKTPTLLAKTGNGAVAFLRDASFC
jgi:hypothetical protein